MPNRKPMRPANNGPSPMWSGPGLRSGSENYVRWSPPCFSTCTMAFAIWPGRRAPGGWCSPRHSSISRFFPRNPAAICNCSANLASAYEKTGDLLHDAIGPGSADGGSLANYQKAFELRQAISRQDKTDLAAQRDLAFSLSKVGDGQFFNGQTDHALWRIISKR